MTQILQKVCSKCRKLKPYNSFNVCNRNKVTGLHSICKQCYKEYRAMKTRYDINNKIVSKKCSKCGILLPACLFGRDSKNTDGLDRWCKKCKNASTREWRKNNVNKDSEYSRKYRLTAAGVYQSLRCSARKRGWSYPDKEEFIQWFDNSVKECHYCGLPQESLTFMTYIIEKHRFRLTIDRKDNLLGYDIDNIVLCCPACNKIKCDVLNESEMLDIGKRHIKPKWTKIIEERGGNHGR